jgi:hypothetical protein
MMIQSLLVYRNPEFLRHLRAELRPTRALIIFCVVIAVCLLIWLGCWGSAQSQIDAFRRAAAHFSPERLAQLEQRSCLEARVNFFRFLIYGQLGILTFWSLLCCAQSISGERERKTWDFQRASQLTSTEFLVGKLLGEPILAYFIVVCCLPATVIAGFRGEFGTRIILSAYLVILSCALFAGLIGLWLSTLSETRSRGVGLIGTLAIYAFLAAAVGWTDSTFPGAAAISPLVPLGQLLGVHFSGPTPTILGKPVSWTLMSLLLYVTFGFWFVVMILRSLKTDFDQIKLLSRWQAVGCVAFLTFIICALFQPSSYTTFTGKTVPPIDSETFASTMASFNGIVLFLMGLALITPYDRLKIWWRSRRGIQSLFDEDGPPWPWLLISATIAYLLLVWGMFVWRNDIGGLAQYALLQGLLESITVLIFVTSDILFLQWCRLTHMRAPLLKGILYLGLYYVAAIVLSTAFGAASGDLNHSKVLALLTPFAAFDVKPSNMAFLPAVIAGLGVQLIVIFILLRMIAARLRHSALTLPHASTNSALA